MATETLTQFTVDDAAERFGKTTGRIRQVCRALQIGRIFYGQIRILSTRDMQRLATYFAANGKNFSKRG